MSIRTKKITVSTQDHIITILGLLYLYNNTSTDKHKLSLLGASLQMSLHVDILYHLYKSISTIMLPLLSLHTCLQSEFLQPSLLVSLSSVILQISLLISLQNKLVLISLWKIFLRRLYEDIFTVTTILSKPEMIVQGIQIKPETSKTTWLYLYSSLYSYSKLFYKLVTYFMFDSKYNIDT